MKNKVSFIMSIILIISMFTSVVFSSEITTEEKFEILKEKKLVNGYEDGLPHLEDEMTREQAAKIIALVFELDLTNETNSPTFSDVEQSRWSYEYIESAVSVGIINGMGDGTFAPDERVTYEQFAKMLAVGYSYKTGLEIKDAETDNGNISVWAQPYVEAAINWGLIDKQEDYTIDADRKFLIDTAYAAELKVEEFEQSLIEFSIESIYAENLIEVILVFNKSLDEETAEDEGNYDLSDYKDVNGAELQEDGKTVVLSVEELK
ncbi:S-layer homology domain-containing protein, partial [Chengkuizengella axinellae]